MAHRLLFFKPFQGNGTNMQPREYNCISGKNKTILIPKTEDRWSNTISPQAFEHNHFLCYFRKRVFEMQLYIISIKKQEDVVTWAETASPDLILQGLPAGGAATSRKKVEQNGQLSPALDSGNAGAGAHLRDHPIPASHSTSGPADCRLIAEG